MGVPTIWIYLCCNYNTFKTEPYRKTHKTSFQSYHCYKNKFVYQKMIIKVLEKCIIIFKVIGVYESLRYVPYSITRFLFENPNRITVCCKRHGTLSDTFILCR